MPSLVWFRRDLRLADNPALRAACAAGTVVVPVFILDPDEPLGSASRWWLHQSLVSLANDCAALGSPLVLRHGRPVDVLRALAIEIGANAVYWNRCYEPYAVVRDTEIKSHFLAQGVSVESFNASLLAEPWEVKTGSGDPYRVFTPFWQRLSGLGPFTKPLVVPDRLSSFATPVGSDDLDAWALQPVNPDWAVGLRAEWEPGERAAATRLSCFLDIDVATYDTDRDRMDRDATSLLAPHLHWGEISPRQVWAAAAMHRDAKPAAAPGVSAFLRQLGWREFSAHLLFHWPDLVNEPLTPIYAQFPWQDPGGHFRAWTKGQTGYPIVDAAMRALWQTGIMHNRARMVVASFLVKHLLIDWREGAAWFEDTLVDADLANNRAGWQWVAGTGADAAPFFRIFNPVLQGEKFDPDGIFVRQWVPELSGLDQRYLHKPWTAPRAALEEAGVRLGDTYPMPLVDHAAARTRALAAYAKVKHQSKEE
jgi:deoxyribodipyrimidine photo-lyase